jgi:hypothetical protein
VTFPYEQLDGLAVSALRHSIAEVKQRWSVNGWATINLLLLAPPSSEGMLSRWSRLHLQSLAHQYALGPRGEQWHV